MNEGHGGFVIGSEMSRGVRDVLVENIEVTGCKKFVKIEPLQDRPDTIQNVVINGAKFA